MLIDQCDHNIRNKNYGIIKPIYWCVDVEIFELDKDLGRLVLFLIDVLGLFKEGMELNLLLFYLDAALEWIVYLLVECLPEGIDLDLLACLGIICDKNIFSFTCQFLCWKTASKKHNYWLDELYSIAKGISFLGRRL